MDLLIVEPLDPEVVDWLAARHRVRVEPALAGEPLALRKALASVRAIVIPPSVALDAHDIEAAPSLRAIGRLSAGAENIDLEACARRGVEVVRPTAASAQAEAEFLVGALLQLLRRVPVVNAEGLLVGRELAGSTVGLIGMTPAAKAVAPLLEAFGARVIGYDPALHGSDELWGRWGIEPVGFRELLAASDGLCVLLVYFTRYNGLFGARMLASSKPNQVLVSLSHSSLFDDAALAEAMTGGRIAAAWLDSLEPGLLDPGRPLRHVDTLQVTPRVASTTRESRRRSAWAVARRIDELLGVAPGRSESFRTSGPGDLVDLPSGGAAPA